MKLGVLTVPLGDQSVDATFDYLSGPGVAAVELGTGGYPGSDHLDHMALLDDSEAQQAFLDTAAEYDLEISALAVHNNPLHPDEERAAEADRELRETIHLASQMGVDTVTCFSGLPVGGPNDESHWKDIVSTLRMVDYEGALSVEHEDSLTSATEGLEKAVDILSRAMFKTEPGDAYWAA
jgi:sugar phosphate isomerase/epimerase